MRALLIVAAVLVGGFVFWQVAERGRAGRSESVQSPPPYAPVAPPPATDSAASWRATGVVMRAEDEKPVPGAHVTVYLKREGRRERHADAVTDADGRFRVGLDTIRALPRHRRFGLRLAVEACAEGYAVDDPANVVDIPFDARTRFVAEFEHTLSEGATINGRAIDERGRPVPLAFVRTRREGDAEDAYGRAAYADGRFRIPVDQPGRWRVTAARGAVGRAETWIEIDRFRTVDVGDLVLGGGRMLEGVVTFWPSGKPVSLAKLDFTSEQEGPAGSLITDANGRFRATGFVDSPHVIALDNATIDPPVWRRSPGAFHRLIVRVPRVTVRVVTEKGETVRGAPLSVLAWPAAAAEEVERCLRAGETLPVAEDAFQGMARADGREDYYFERGSFVVVGVVATGYAVAWQSARLLEARDHSITLVLRRVVTGSVRSTLLVDGRPVKHVLTLREKRTGAVLDGSSVVEPGRVLEGVPPGRYDVVMQHDERPHALSKMWGHTFPVEGGGVVRAGETAEIQATGRRGARLGLVFKLGKTRGHELPQVHKILLDTTLATRLEDWTDRPFRTTWPSTSLDLVEPGPYRVRVELYGRDPIERDVELAPGKTTFVTIVLD